jgi:hypothetical protein
MLLPDEYGAAVRRLHTWATEAGRDPGAIALTLRVPLDVRSRRSKAPGGARPLFQGTPDQVLGDVRQYQALGVSHLVFDATVPDLRAFLASMERFAEDVRPRVRGRPRTA